MITVQQISKSLGNFALKDITFALPKGYIMGIIGANGSGKTSLLHILLGLYQPDSGSVQHCFSDIRDAIGSVLQGDWFLPGLTLLQNGTLYGQYYKKYDKEQFLSYLDAFSLDKHKKFKQLSKGEQLKFQMAFALSHDAKLLILDEPTANFDREFRKQFFSLLTNFVADGEHSVILVTHILEDLDQIADYILYMKQGKMLIFEEKEALYNQYRSVMGETYKVNLLEADRVVYKEENVYSSKALVRHNAYLHYDEALTVNRPDLEEIFYAFEKGGK